MLNWLLLLLWHGRNSGGAVSGPFAPVLLTDVIVVSRPVEVVVLELTPVVTSVALPVTVAAAPAPTVLTPLSS